MITREVFHHHPDGFFDRLSKNRLPLPLAADKVGVAELLDVMGNSGQGNIKIAGHVADGWTHFLIQGCLSSPRRICSKTPRRVSLDRALKAATTRPRSFADFPISFFLGMASLLQDIYLDVYIVVKTYTNFQTFSQLVIFKYFPKLSLPVRNKSSASIKMLDFNL